MKAKDHGLRPALERKLQEYILRRQEFEQFKRLDHPYLLAAFQAGHDSIWDSSTNVVGVAYQKWRERFAKEEQEKYKRERTQAPSL